MRYKYIHLVTIICLATFQLFAQSKREYLKENRFDLSDKTFQFPEKSFKLIGFGAYHGSVKTEETELYLLENLMINGLIHYYLPETDYSTAYFYNQYLQTGDTVLLKDLIYYYGCRVPQERSIEAYDKWKTLRELNLSLPSEKRIEVVGIDEIANYKYTIKHLLIHLGSDLNAIPSIKRLRQLIINTEVDFSAYYESDAMKYLKEFVEAYEMNKEEIDNSIEDKASFDHILNNIRQTFNSKNEREETMYSNYIILSKIYNFNHLPQFTRLGFFHLEKSREGKMGYPSFFTRLIENGNYKKTDLISIIGYLTNSKVLWEERYDKKGVYKGYITKSGFGIGDYWKEYFRGIKELKATKISDLTLFRLNLLHSPYQENVPDLIEIKMVLNKSNKAKLKGMSTLDFIDYAVLISNSNANTPIQEKKYISFQL